MLNHTKAEQRPIVILFICAFIINAFMCTMSPFRDHLFSCDTNCFYMAGKCMAHGYIPYIDFVDTKGPLLFALYAIGYLISPDKTYGMYILASTSSFLTFFLLYKAFKEFGLQSSLAILAVIICSFTLYKNNIFGYGARVEHLVLPCIPWIMIHLNRIFLTKQIPTKIYDWILTGIALGTSSAIFLLTKFIYIVFPCISLVMLLAYLWKNKILKSAPALLLSYIASAFVIIAPFLLYMYKVGCLEEFSYVYFNLSSKNALKSEESNIVNIAQQILSLYGDWWTRNPKIILILAASVIPLLTNIYSKRASLFSRLLLFFSLLSIGACSLLGLYRYYALMFMPLTLYIIAPVISKLGKLSLLKRNHYFISTFCFILCIVLNFYIPQEKLAEKYIKTGGNHTETYEKIKKLFASQPNARILYLDTLSHGFELENQIFPAHPTWFYFNFADNLSATELQTGLKKGKPDFVITKQDSEHSNHLKEQGYTNEIDYIEGERFIFRMSVWRRNNDNLSEDI